MFVDDLETASDHDVALNGLNLQLASSCGALADASARRRPPAAQRDDMTLGHVLDHVVARALARLPLTAYSLQLPGFG